MDPGVIIVSDDCLGLQQTILGMDEIQTCWEQFFVQQNNNAPFSTSQPRPIEEAWETAFTICQRIRATIPTIGHTSTAHLASRCPVTVPALSEQMVWAKVADDFGGAEYSALVEHKDKDGQVEVARTVSMVCQGRVQIQLRN